MQHCFTTSYQQISRWGQGNRRLERDEDWELGYAVYGTAARVSLGLSTSSLHWKLKFRRSLKWKTDPLIPTPQTRFSPLFPALCRFNSNSALTNCGNIALPSNPPVPNSDTSWASLGWFPSTVADKLDGRITKLVGPAENRDGPAWICPWAETRPDV